MGERLARRQFLCGIAASAAVAVLAACGGSKVTETPKPAATSAASASASAASTSGTVSPAGSAASSSLAGKVTLYTSAVQTDADGLKAAFTRKYPNVAVTVYRDGTEKVIAKLRAEQDAKSIQADVLLIADAPTMETLKADTFLQPYKSPLAASYDKQFVDAEGYYTGTKIINSGIAVNTTANLPKPA
ncbi:MAG TPA: hypothetical protein VIG44_09020, partial [Thermomicrobiales bacterium]